MFVMHVVNLRLAHLLVVRGSYRVFAVLVACTHVCLAQGLELKEIRPLAIVGVKSISFAFTLVAEPLRLTTLGQ